MAQSYKSGWAKVCLNISGLHTKRFYNFKQSFLKVFSGPIWDPRIEIWVPRIIEDYHRVPRIRETGSLTFSLKKTVLRVIIFFFSDVDLLCSPR